MRRLLTLSAILIFSIACAHTPEAPSCTPDPVVDDSPVACMNNPHGEQRVCGFVSGSCIEYVLRESCGSHWQWLTQECDGEESL